MSNYKNSNKIRNSLAFLISRIFEPFILLILLFVILAIVFKPEVVIILSVLGMFFFLISFFSLGYKKKWFSDIELTDRRQRCLFNTVVSIAGLLLLLVIFLFGDKVLITYYLVIYSWFLLFTIITFFWKISGHTGASTLFFMILASLFGIQYLLLFLFIPFISWSRVYRKKHTLAQVVGGVILALVAFGAGFLLL